MSAEAIPVTRFRTSDYPGPEQFDAWKDRVSVVFDVAPATDAKRGFAAEAQAYHLGDFVLTRTRLQGQFFLRTRRQARSDLLDHYLVQLYCDGGYIGEADGVEIEVEAGTVSILDIARPVSTQATTADVLTLVVPRDIMDEALPSADNLHGMILNEASGGLLADYLTSLERRLPGLDASQAPHIVRATSDLLAACIRPSAEHRERARPQIEAIQRQKVTKLIDRRLASSTLSVTEICAAVGVSRTQLYMLMKPFGGVTRYIQSRRLQRIHAALADPSDMRSIMEIASSYGFTNHAHMTRAFRLHFGYPPSDVRRDAGAAVLQRAFGAVRDHGARRGSDGPGFDDWIRALHR